MKKVFMTLLTVVVMSSLALATTYVSFKLYPEKRAYDYYGGWTGMRDPVISACSKISAQTTASCSYYWGTGNFVSAATSANEFRKDINTKFGAGTKTTIKLGIAYNMFSGGQALGDYRWIVAVDYGTSGKSYSDGVIMHEMGHAMGGCPEYCPYFYQEAGKMIRCVMYGDYIWGNPPSKGYCTTCRGKIKAQYP